MSHSVSLLPSVLGSLGQQILLAFATLCSIGMGIYVHRKYDSVNSRYLAWFFLTISLIPLANAIRNGISPQGATRLLDLIYNLNYELQFLVGWLAGMIFWLAFVVTYTSGIGAREMRYLRTGGPVSVIVVIGLRVPHSFQDAGVVQIGDTAESLELYGAMLALLLAFGIMGYGAIQLFRTARTHPASTIRGATLLTLPVVWLFAALFLLSPLGTSQAEAIGFGILASAGTIGITIIYTDVLEETPASQMVGRDTAVEAIEAGIVVLNPQGTIIDVNDAAEQLFENSMDQFVGQSLGDVLPPGVDAQSIETMGKSVFEIPRSNRIIRSQTTHATDDSGRELGRTIVFHDITDERQRQQRIQVLNRVLRHNLRNDLNAVNGYAGLAEESDDPSEYLLQIQDTAADLISIGEKAREIENIVAEERQSRAKNLEETLEQAVDEVETELQDCQISIHKPLPDTQVNGSVLLSVVRELVENACRHNDAEQPVVEIQSEVTDGEYPLNIQVSDNGPGIPDHELAPLLEGTETALEHGSGLGLWLIHWGVTHLNGEIEFEPDEPRGTIATLHLPVSD